MADTSGRSDSVLRASAHTLDIELIKQATELRRTADGRSGVVASGGVVLSAEPDANARLWFRQVGAPSKAFHTASVPARPPMIVDLIRVAPRALRDLYSSDILRSATLEDYSPYGPLVENPRRLLAGPWLHLRGRIRNQRGECCNW
jgi:hypothetical protein